ncbi:WD40 repeat-like protein [Microthyrium microscopicum]|uniref:WD40 repeat-like protein n=1 Tax=Microthyrium microscopicum TaxID=703497 RepID=A0A6A6U739_9PEZI|nr:WD40 repeat-like protein [Microthyrium microscopicum]
MIISLLPTIEEQLLEMASRAFPSTHHLVAVTQKNVLTWDSNGIRRIFTSGSSGIIAAKESKNGTLAISDSHLVLLHEVEKGLERSYRLKGAEGQIRLLHFSANSDILYFSTTLLDSIQIYSLRESKLLDPGPTHPSPPIALAISSTSHLLLSASENPPTVYLQSLTYAGAPKLLIPEATTAPVVHAAFHPKRPNIFLLSFKDGSLAVYDASRLSKARGKDAEDLSTYTAEVRAFPQLHRVASSTYQTEQAGNMRPRAVSLSVTAASFLPNSQTKVVTVGADGKCNILDFETKMILKTFHIKGPATSLSVLPGVPVNQTSKKPAASKNASGVAQPSKLPAASGKARQSSVAKPQVTSNLLAIGRVDGKVFVYDEQGRLLAQKTVDDGAGQVLDVDWIAGASPEALGDWTTVNFNDEKDFDLGISATSSRAASRKSSKDKALLDKTLPAVPTTVKFEDHVVAIKEEDFDTVRHVPILGPTTADIPGHVGKTYMDLFSPVKPPAARSPVRSTPRSRPRITSATFVEYEDAAPTLPEKDQVLSPPPKAMLPPRVPDRPLPRSLGVKPGTKAMPLKKSMSPKRRNSPGKAAVKKSKGSFLSIASDLLTTPGLFSSTPASERSTSNSKILSDIRKMGGAGTQRPVRTSQGGKSPPGQITFPSDIRLNQNFMSPIALGGYHEMRC